MNYERNEMTPEYIGKLNKLIDKLYIRKDSLEFRYPVDYIGLGNSN